MFPAGIIMIMDVEMKPVVGFEEYFKVTRCGKIWSLRSNRFLKTHQGKQGYLTLTTRIGGRDGKAWLIKVHRAVAQAYIPNPENKPCVNHKNGIKTDNHVDNLEWATYAENTRHAFDTGLAVARKGEELHNSRLTEEDVLDIRRRYTPWCKKNGARALSREYGIVHSAIVRVASGAGWKDVPFE